MHILEDNSLPISPDEGKAEENFPFQSYIPSASRHFTGDELLPVYPQQNSAFGADVYGKIRVEGTGEIILVDNANCSALSQFNFAENGTQIWQLWLYY